VRPWLTEQEIKTAQEVIREDLARRRKNKPKLVLADFVVSLMASLGMTREVAAALSSWGPTYFEDVPERHFAVFGLADPAEVVPELKRLNLRMSRPKHVHGVLA